MGKTLIEFRSIHNPFGESSQITVDFYRDLPKRFKSAIVVAAQNSTPIHPEFWQCLLAAAAHYRAEIFVIPLRYKNPTSVWSNSQKNAELWCPEVKDYLWNRRLDLNPNLKLLADVPTQPTDTTPLSGFDAMSGCFSGIYGHTKLQSQTVPVPSGRMAKVLTTTGACTVENYTITKRGKIGEFHHSLSAMLVELEGPRFHMRQLHYSKTHNSVTDGAKGITFHPNASVTSAPRPLALGCGDIHVDFIDPQVMRATHRLLQQLNPVNVVLPDLLDSYAINHHTRHDPFVQAAKHDAGRNDIKAETLRAINWTRKLAREFTETKWAVQASNHNDMLRRWVVDSMRNGFNDHTNSEFGLETALHMRRGARMTDKGAEYPDPLHYWFRQQRDLEKNIALLDLDEPFMVADIDMGQHGDLGSNGAKGSAKGFAHQGVKTVTFHTHMDRIYEGNYGAGTKTRLRLEYNHGASGWSNADVLVQWDAKRQIVRYIDGHYCR